MIHFTGEYAKCGKKTASGAVRVVNKTTAKAEYSLEYGSVLEL